MNRRFTRITLSILVLVVLMTPLARADRRSAGMQGGETTRATAFITPAADAPFYRTVERKLRDGLNALNYSDLTASRIHLRWAQGKLNGHGSHVDKQLAGEVAAALSFIRHYQIGQAVQILRSLIARVHSMGWGSAVSVQVPAATKTTSKSETRQIELLEKTIKKLKDRQVTDARKSLKELNQNVTTAKASTLNPDSIRVLKSLDLHFDNQDSETLISTLESMLKELKQK